MKLKLFVIMMVAIVAVISTGCNEQIPVSSPTPLAVDNDDNAGNIADNTDTPVQRAEEADSVPVPSAEKEVASTVPEDADSTPTTHTFTVTGGYFYYKINGENNPSLRVKQGDTVKIEFSSEEGLHDWVVDAFAARTKKGNPGETTSVEFVADKKGTFEYYCSVGSHRNMGMKGNLVVE